MKSSDNFVIKTKGLCKTFFSKVRGKMKTVVAVKNVNLFVKKGEIFGFLGPNGAGKSTTLKIFATILSPTNGEVSIIGYDLDKNKKLIRQNIGYVSQAGGTDEYSTGRENLILQARLHGLDHATAKNNAMEFVERFQMSSFIDRLPSTYSGGQKRRLDIALGMIHYPKLLLLDEPTQGLDPQSRAYIWNEIKKLKNEGVTIFLTTHYMEEAEKLCNTIAIIDNGTIIKQGNLSKLKDAIDIDIIKFSFSDCSIAQKAAELIKEKTQVLKIQISNNFLHISVQNGEKLLPIFLRLFEISNFNTQTISLSTPNLNDVFLNYTGYSLREDKR